MKKEEGRYKKRKIKESREVQKVSGGEEGKKRRE